MVLSLLSSLMVKQAFFGSPFYSSSSSLSPTTSFLLLTSLQLSPHSENRYFLYLIMGSGQEYHFCDVDVYITKTKSQVSVTFLPYYNFISHQSVFVTSFLCYSFTPQCLYFTDTFLSFLNPSFLASLCQYSNNYVFLHGSLPLVPLTQTVLFHFSYYCFFGASYSLLLFLCAIFIPLFFFISSLHFVLFFSFSVVLAFSGH